MPIGLVVVCCMVLIERWKGLRNAPIFAAATCKVPKCWNWRLMHCQCSDDDIGCRISAAYDMLLLVILA
jgi:hypothetical protein